MTPYEKEYEETGKKIGNGTDETASAQTQPPVVAKTEESKKGTGHRRDIVPAMKVVTTPNQVYKPNQRGSTNCPGFS